MDIDEDCAKRGSSSAWPGIGANDRSLRACRRPAVWSPGETLELTHACHFVAAQPGRHPL